MNYSNFFLNNYYLNFATSLIFLIVFYLKVFFFNDYLKGKNILIFKENSLIFLFFLFFSFYSILINLFLILKIVQYLYLLVIFELFFLFYFFYYYSKKKKISISNKFSIKNYFYLFFIINLILISILPISDADSVVYHLAMPFDIYAIGEFPNNFSKYFEYAMFGNSEILLFFSVILRSDNFGSILNLFTLFFFIFTQKNSKYFKLIIFSTPLLIFFISTQKLQLFFGILFLLLFILIHEKKLKSNLEIFLTILLLFFYISGKTSYILLSIPLFIYLFIQVKNIKLIFVSFISGFILFLLPIFYLKFVNYGNFISPFFENIFGQNQIIFNALSSWMKTNQGWTLDTKFNFNYLIRPFFPISLGKISEGFGLMFLIMLLNKKIIKELHYIPVAMILIIFAVGQTLPRYYFEAYLILAYYFNKPNKFTEIVIFSQISIIFLLALTFNFLSYKEILNKDFKNQYMEKFSYSYLNSKLIKKEKLQGNILTFSTGRNTIFFDNNLHSPMYIGVMSAFNKEYKKNVSNFISENNINFVITTDIKKDLGLPMECYSFEKKDDILQKSVVRNFFVNFRSKNGQNYSIYNVINDCK